MSGPPRASHSHQRRGAPAGPEATRANSATGRPVGAERARAHSLPSLLETLPPDIYDRLIPHLNQVSLEARQVLYWPDETIQYVYFPISGVVSALALIGQGSNVEVGIIGKEGVVGLPVFLDGTTASHRVVCQIGGEAWRMPAHVFDRQSHQIPAFETLLFHYTRTFLTQVSQVGACSRSHSLEQQCARWLLMAQDRVGDEFRLTHEFLAEMLGVRRATVTEVMQHLLHQGAISYRRGVITVVDRTRLEASSCYCYGAIAAAYDWLLPRSPTPDQ
ncbi:MAG: Crp/Fnr family transcriptional regulator [Chloroflexi bacterium]|nr:Crp/Fnr family transcriptional regulator [Chloroflexota bacterium]